VSGLDPRPLTGRVALVTGGSQGLGLGMAEALARAGADVALVARSRDRLEAAAERLRGHGGQVLSVSVDLSDTAAAVDAVDTVAAELGRLDVLITSAAAQLRKPFLEVAPDEFDRLVSVNLRAVYFMCQAAARQMLAREPVNGRARGKIINVASLTAVGAWPDVSVYGTTKGGVVQLTKAMALELAREGICANAIGPGTFRTELTEPIYNDPERSQEIRSRIPMGRPGLPDDLGGATVFLASDASDYVTGQVLWVDGGWTVT
jgi:2-dehydro-3-deoxy-D-gluconate 5-dehydrogenase